MKDYTYQDMLKMQEDAAVRVREMKRRAAIAVEEDNDRTEPEKKNVIPDEVRHISYPVEIQEQNRHENESCEENQNEIPDKVKSEGDSMLILLILILISRDEADPLTSLALLYLLL